METKELQHLKAIGSIDYYLRADQIIYAEFDESASAKDLTVDDINVGLHLLEEQSKIQGRPLLVLINLHKVPPLSIEVRKHLRSKDVSQFRKNSKATALIIPNSFSRLFGNLVLTLVAGQTMKLFANEEDAVNWLNNH